MPIDLPILDGEEWWSGQVIDDSDSLINSLLDLTKSCIELKITLEESKLLHAELSLHNVAHNIEIQTDKWIAFCANLRDAETSKMADEVEHKLNAYVSKHVKK